MEVVGQEKKSTWRWFLRLLAKDLKIESPKDYTFISDKQKGLILAMEEVMPGVEHRFCVRHLHNNFKQQHKGLALKNILWKCARASTMLYFNMALEEMRAVDVAAYNWLSSKPDKVADSEDVNDVSVQREGLDLGADNVSVEREVFWDSAIASADALCSNTMLGGEELTQTSRVVASQPVSGVKKAKKVVRRSTKIMNSPKKGPITVDFQDLTKSSGEGSSTIHVGVLKSKNQGRKLPKGHLMKGDKRYITVAAMRADMAHQRKQAK